MPLELIARNAEVGRILDDLEKYAGWLGRGIESRRVRNDVTALRAILGGDDVELQDTVQALVIDISRVPSSSAIRALLHKSVRDLRTVVSHRLTERPDPRD
jgi:hypothetical protein